MKIIRLLVLFFVIVLGLMLMVINTKFNGNRWQFINTNSGPLRLDPTAEVNLFFNELGATGKTLVFIRDREINSMKGYEAWNPLPDFDDRIVLACKGNKVMGLVNVIFIDVDAERIKSDNSQAKVNDLLPNLISVCINNSLMKRQATSGDNKIQNLINLSQGMLRME